ncbi:MAG: aldehyde dehydrogenase family protein [candidate division KSB1 bacterium]|nr:aldehyde dehydrogenase family protein [candidate division KSB1 bacterium]MDZ7295882.1 aldehyde dehydrogenase family protein [candidate division KSB1 bacterium]MDZ7379288.1 aldehyde dehydrogenase family protein [candidate division KSB1 bacterium]MDZ7385392.1 aldehyde dehydrogenase family protein [candidate division KSB1 bacterium]MDZ7392196.1 aldehyde dehydrogenase family protein [candidate division KSB1 bacterium]
MYDFLKTLGIEKENSGGCTGTQWLKGNGGLLQSVSPIDGEVIAAVRQVDEQEYEAIVAKAQEAFKWWRMVPAPKRGEVVRQIGLKLREYKEPLGKLVTLEMGKILPEGEGEVQEMIDMADFAVGLSRQLYGLTMQSERPMHRMYEQWHPLGIVGIITAFNFPVAVWSWNAMIALVCGDTMIWKPSSLTPLCAIAVHKIMADVLKANGLPEGIVNLAVGSGRVVGERMIHDTRIPLISATGSCEMGRRIGAVVGQRLGRTILELGGNNGIIVMEDANMDLVVRAVLFGAVGTAGQRCTTTRRLIVQQTVFDSLLQRLVNAYKQVRIGNPLEKGVLMGPMVARSEVEVFLRAIEIIKEQGGEIVYGGRVLTGPQFKSGCYVEPTIVKARPDMPIVGEETFAPILYVMPFSTLDEAIEIHNSVEQGLSSAMFTTNLLAAETFLSARGSDCGIANINIGTSGAEIGGAFGGEKSTGGGREAGSDAWKAYMRRQTNTINWSTELPLAQGIKFGD